MSFRLRAHILLQQTTSLLHTKSHSWVQVLPLSTHEVPRRAARRHRHRRRRENAPNKHLLLLLLLLRQGNLGQVMRMRLVCVEMRVVHRQGTERSEPWRVGAGNRGRRFDRRLEVLRGPSRRKSQRATLRPAQSFQNVNAQSAFPLGRSLRACPPTSLLPRASGSARKAAERSGRPRSSRACRPGYSSARQRRRGNAATACAAVAAGGRC